MTGTRRCLAATQNLSPACPWPLALAPAPHSLLCQLANLAMAMPGARFLGKTAIQHLLRGLELARALKDG